MRKRFLATLASIALAVGLAVTGSTPALADTSNQFVGYMAHNTGLNRYLDQATASWDVSCHADTSNTHSCARWVGTTGDGPSGGLWQAGEFVDNSLGQGSQPVFFVEVPDGPCKSAVGDGTGAPKIYWVLGVGDRILVHTYVWDTSLEVYFSDITTGLVVDYTYPCAYAYHYRGSDASFFAERASSCPGGHLTQLGQFTDNDILGPSVHAVGENASTYHQLGSLSNSRTTTMYDAAGHSLATSGSLGSNSNFLLNWNQLGTYDAC